MKFKILPDGSQHHMTQNLSHILSKHCLLFILVVTISMPATSLEDSSGLAVIGNSITKHNKSRDLDWDCECGMAATNGANDFAHILAANLNKHLAVENASYLERPSAVPEAKWRDLNLMIKKSNVVVIQLGDNARAPYDYFYQSYNRLLTNISGKNKLYCVSTYWKNDQIDKFIQKSCSQNSGVYIFIGDIRVDKKNLDFHYKKFKVEAVNDHPKDWGMREIANRILAKAGH
jgi:hypothetical protein